MADEERWDEEEDEDVADPGFIGGGGPASTLPEYEDHDEEEHHLADTDHQEL